MSRIASHAELPDVPAFQLEAVHRMQGDLMRAAERTLGPRAHDFNIAPARFVMGSTGCTTRIGTEISIELELNAAKDWQCCATILGHELVHALDGLTGYPTWLEEGIACAFGLGQCAAMFDEAPPFYLVKGRYLEAFQMVAAIPNQLAVVKALRAQGTPLCLVTPQQLIDTAQGVDAVIARKLCRTFGDVPAVAGRVITR